MTNPFADSQVGLPPQQPPQQQQFAHPNQDSTGAVDFGFSNGAQKPAGPGGDAKVGGHNPFSSGLDWGMPQQQQPQPQPSGNNGGMFPPIGGQPPAQQQPADPFNFDASAAQAQPQPVAVDNNFNFDAFGAQPQPAAPQQQVGQVDDIMAAFDQPALNKERSAFEDEDGDLDSDIDGDAPQIGVLNGGGLQHQPSFTKNFGQIEAGAMSMRQANLYGEEEKKEQINLSEVASSQYFKQPSMPPIQEAADKEGGAFPDQQQANPPQNQLPQDIIDAQSAFPDMDLDIIKELYIQADRSKAVLFEMLFQMANPDAVAEAPLQHQNNFEQSQEDDAEQVAMIAALAGYEMGGPNNAPMTEQEIADMRMAAQLQQQYVNRATRASQADNRRAGAQQRSSQNRQLRQQQEAMRAYERNPQALIANPAAEGERQPAGGQQRPRLQQQQSQDFQDVNLDSESDQWQFRQDNKAAKKNGIKSGPAAGEKKGFFANIFGCCTSKKSAAPQSKNSVPKPEKAKKPAPPSKSQQKEQPKKEEEKQVVSESEDAGEISL